MEANQNNEQEAVNKMYQFAANLLLKEKRSLDETKNALISKGLDAASATIVVENLQAQISSAKKERAKKDMLYGGLWCVGGAIASAADIGFIFWGAIIFGGVQFFKGLTNA